MTAWNTRTPSRKAADSGAAFSANGGRSHIPAAFGGGIVPSGRYRRRHGVRPVPYAAACVPSPRRHAYSRRAVRDFLHIESSLRHDGPRLRAAENRLYAHRRRELSALRADGQPVVFVTSAVFNPIDGKNDRVSPPSPEIRGRKTKKISKKCKKHLSLQSEMV